MTLEGVWFWKNEENVSLPGPDNFELPEACLILGL